MSDLRLKSSDPHSGRSYERESKHDFLLSSKNFSSITSKNTSVGQTPNREGLNTERNNSSSNLRIATHIYSIGQPRNHKKAVESVLAQIHQSRDSSAEPTIPLTNSAEKKIFNQIYKLKTIKFRAYINDSETRPKKMINESQSTKKVLRSREGKRLEDSRNISQILNQISQRDLSNSSHHRIVFENNNLPYSVDKIVLDNDAFNSNNNNRPTTFYQKNMLISTKEIENPQRSQRKYYKNHDMPFPNPPSYKKESKPNTSQMRRVGDLDLFKINQRPLNVIKQEPIAPSKSRNQSGKLHKRGFSMDQAPIMINSTIIQPQKSGHIIISSNKRSPVESQQNIPQPSQNQNGQMDETTFYEQFFDTNKLTFEFEKVILALRNKRKTEGYSGTLTSTLNTRQTLHTRTRSIEEHQNLPTSKPNSRLVSKRFSLADMR